MVRILILVAGVAVLSLSVMAGASAILKGRPGFCVSCHLDDSTSLHAEKNRLFMREPPANLAGLHRKKLPGGSGCAECHEGRTVRTRLALAFSEAQNTFRYFFRTYEEPKKMDAHQMPDGNCIPCHGEIKGGPGRFHGFSAHRPKVSVTCIACHRAHEKGDAGRHFIDEARLVPVCRKCHANIPAGYRPDPRDVS